MVSLIQHRRSNVSGHVPASLVTGELAINEADSDLYYLDNGVVTQKNLVEPKKLLASGGVTNVANLTIDLSVATYGVMEGFEIILSELRSATNSVSFLMRLGDTGGLKTGSSSYNYSHNAGDSGYTTNTYDWQSGITGSSFDLTQETSLVTGAGKGGLFYLRLPTNDSAIVNECGITCDNVLTRSSSRIYINNMVGYYASGNLVLSQCQFFFSSGNIANCKYAVIGIQP